MNRKLLLIVALVGVASQAVFARARVNAVCMQGNQTITVAGTTSSAATPVQRSYPACVVTVYITGSGGTKASIYSDNSGTVLSNPFTVGTSPETATNGNYFFYADNGRYDVQMSAGGIPSPFTVGDNLIWDPKLVVPSVLDFGAKCDGTTDDTTAIQNAINATTAAGTWLMLPGGYCEATALTFPDNLHLYGQGPAQSFLQQRAGSAANNTPFITNSNQSSGNSNISLSQFALDGNVSSQGGATNVTALSLVKLTNFTASYMAFQNIGGRPIYGYGWNSFVVDHSACTVYGSLSADFPNTACIEMDFADATTASSNIRLTNNSIDGAGSHVGGFKLAGTSTYPFSDIVVTGNRIIVGNVNPSVNNTLGIELYSDSGVGFFNYVISDNVIRGESSSSPTSTSTGGQFGISACGSGGNVGSIVSNTIRWMGLYSIETCGSEVTVSGNTIDTGAQIIANGSLTATLRNVTITANTIYNPVGLTCSPCGVNGSPAIILYTSGGNAIINASVIANTIRYLNQTPDAPNAMAIKIQCNGSGGSISGTVINDNNATGPGSAYTVTGVDLENDGSCPVDSTIVNGNTFTGFSVGVATGSTTNSLVSNNKYPATASMYTGSAATSDIFADVTISSNYTNAWSSMTPSYNILMTKIGQYFQTGAVGSMYPNVMTWNTTNGGDCSIGGVISTNSLQNTSTNASPYGWTQTSGSAYSRAGYYQFGSCAFRVAFGPATGSGPNPPSDYPVFVAEDSAANSGSVTEGGVGIGALGIVAGARIVNVFTAKGSVTPGTISTLGTYDGGTFTVTGCAAGDITGGSLTTLTDQNGIVITNATTNGVHVGVFNSSSGNLTPGNGTIKVWCIHTNQ